MDTYQPPFRWNLRYRESLGRLLDGPRAPAYPEFVDDLLACAARCLALSHRCMAYEGWPSGEQGGPYSTPPGRAITEEAAH